ncbi:CBS domain protein [Humitalea rosea]|uniref:CBS domain protein n=1 Tax=Humitalea rosea TaxID=990373 RepID=A0A2W7ISN3_9PROT|nr:CBS domain-containing protein [Humitalea rosea]PZW48720.1 CBS domain protein [Humitalea rosea]
MIIATILSQKGSNVVTVRPEDDLGTIAATLASNRIGAVLVLDAAGALVGIVSERDIVRHLAQAGAAALAQRASLVMTRGLHTVTPQTSVTEAMGMMTDRRIRHLPVLDEGRLAGMVSIGDLVKVRMSEIEQEAEHLRAFVTAA